MPDDFLEADMPGPNGSERRIKINWSIPIGVGVALMPGLLAGGMLWGQITGKVEDSQRQINVLNAQVSRLQDKGDDQAKVGGQVQTQIAVISSRLDQVFGQLAQISNKLETPQRDNRDNR